MPRVPGVVPVWASCRLRPEQEKVMSKTERRWCRIGWRAASRGYIPPPGSVVGTAAGLAFIRGARAFASANRRGSVERAGSTPAPFVHEDTGEVVTRFGRVSIWENTEPTSYRAGAGAFLSEMCHAAIVDIPRTALHKRHNVAA